MAELATTQPMAVIGSGFAGAVVASQLGRAGVPVVVLDRGPRDTPSARSMGIVERAPLPQMPSRLPTRAIAAWAEHVGAGFGERLRGDVRSAGVGAVVAGRSRDIAHAGSRQPRERGGPTSTLVAAVRLPDAVHATVRPFSLYWPHATDIFVRLPA
ncbi:MAG: FAD-dependent oxidoreductase [Gammaproteobacteria bacterium]